MPSFLPGYWLKASVHWKLGLPMGCSKHGSLFPHSWVTWGRKSEKRKIRQESQFLITSSLKRHNISSAICCCLSTATLAQYRRSLHRVWKTRRGDCEVIVEVGYHSLSSGPQCSMSFPHTDYNHLLRYTNILLLDSISSKSRILYLNQVQVDWAFHYLS